VKPPAPQPVNGVDSRPATRSSYPRDEQLRTISRCIDLMFVAKNLERIGDHATNIAEMVYYAATGEHMTDRPGKSPR
jgi:phosphate uptake regulator